MPKAESANSDRTSAISRNLISIGDIPDSDLQWLLDRGRTHALSPDPPTKTLEGFVVGIYFTKTSTRTRTAFSSAALRLGAGVVTYQAGDLQIATGETLEDTGRVMAKMLDVLVVRTAGDPAEMHALGAGHDMAVVNAMSAEEHPTQALCDLTYLLTRVSTLDGMRFLYLGEGNNTASALSLALARFSDAKIEFRTPPGYGIEPGFLDTAHDLSARTGARIVERHDLDELPDQVDVIYTTRWTTTGTAKVDPGWRSKFEPFRVTEALMRRYPEAIFMHDLPAHRGEEVDAAVIDGPRSVVLDQAACKMYSAMATLEWLLLPGDRDALDIPQ